MATAEDEPIQHHGALVGWTHEDLGDRVMICMQSRRPLSPDGMADETRLMMTKNQAAVLANYLFGISGRLPQPARKRRWFA
ncbi:hypothetical protein [Tsuneonella amylolytica]|uniref:hypothetical protein n=1 Tax=Tsuneonella amylolytica TaxID=2338327 RepID=UPI000EAA181E|nr:hypothetical protein [Tsuneonella amylolytica]